MSALGYAWLVGNLKLRVRLPERTSSISTSVNSRVDTPDRSLFPVGVSIEHSPLGHLEFALRHEGINLEIIEAAFVHIPPGDLIERLRTSPSGEFIRRACFLWEWLYGDALNAGVPPTGNYIDFFSPDDYIVASNPIRSPTYRVNDNALGNREFCPVVRRAGVPANLDLAELMESAKQSLAEATDGDDLYDRAIRYLYLSETRGSFAIENEAPGAQKEERFIQLLRRVGEKGSITEDWLVDLQNTVVKDAFSHEASFRTRQNWLEDNTGRVSYFPPQPGKVLGRLMEGWEAFVNDKARGVDPLVKAACGAFGFVYLHPFMDGNGRLHRFLIHQILAQAGALPENVIVPVSAVIMKNIPAYHEVLKGFSDPTRSLWDYRFIDEAPLVSEAPGGGPYRFFDASREVAFLQSMIRTAVLDEIPREIAYLRGYDEAFSHIDGKYNLPKSDISALIRMIRSNGNTLSQNRRKQFEHLTPPVLDDIESLVKASFAKTEPTPAAAAVIDKAALEAKANEEGLTFRGPVSRTSLMSRVLTRAIQNKASAGEEGARMAKAGEISEDALRTLFQDEKRPAATPKSKSNKP